MNPSSPWKVPTPLLGSVMVRVSPHVCVQMERDQPSVLGAWASSFLIAPAKIAPPAEAYARVTLLAYYVRNSEFNFRSPDMIIYEVAQQEWCPGLSVQAAHN
jgi:hypothetical protein